MTGQTRVGFALIAAGLAGIAVTIWATWHAHRPPVPDVVGQVEAVERRVVYLLHDVGREAGPLVCGCEPASVGTAPQVRRAGR